MITTLATFFYQILLRDWNRKDMANVHDGFPTIQVDPGYSEIRNFVQSELNFSRLYLSQQDFQCGLLCKEEYLARSRQSLAALEEVQKNKRLVQFEKI